MMGHHKEYLILQINKIRPGKICNLAMLFVYKEIFLILRNINTA